MSFQLSPWRNRLARSAVNRKVGGSSPPGDDISFVFSIQRLYKGNFFQYISCFLSNMIKTTLKDEQKHTQKQVFSKRLKMKQNPAKIEADF